MELLSHAGSQMASANPEREEFKSNFLNVFNLKSLHIEAP
jgi:hypothetical protein